MQALNEINSLWKELGIALEVSNNDIHSIYQKHQTATSRLYDILVIWMDRSHSVTWLTVIETVKGDIINKPNLAKKIKELALCFIENDRKDHHKSHPSSPPTSPIKTTLAITTIMWCAIIVIIAVFIALYIKFDYW